VTLGSVERGHNYDGMMSVCRYNYDDYRPIYRPRSIVNDYKCLCLGLMKRSFDRRLLRVA